MPTDTMLLERANTAYEETGSLVITASMSKAERRAAMAAAINDAHVERPSASIDPDATHQNR